MFNPATNRLHYGLYANIADHHVINITLDFSSAGYGAGVAQLPHIEAIPVAPTLSPLAGENHQQIQAKINATAKKAINSNGLRGAILSA